MNSREEVLNMFPLLASLSPEDREALSGHLEESSYEPGQRVYAEGEPVASMFLVQTGVVDLVAMLETGVEHCFLTVRAGSMFGALALMGSGVTAGSAVAVERTTVLRLGREPLHAFGQDHPDAAVTLWQGICSTVGVQMETIVDDYRRITGWAREVTRVSELGLESLAANGRELEVDFLSGASVRGRLLKVETVAAGTLITLAASDGSIQIIPFHAVGRFALAEPLPPAAADNPML